MRRILKTFCTLGVVGLFAAQAQAIPTLQVYIDGATYNDVTETWVTTASTFDIWIIGDVGSVGSILDMQLSAAYLTSETGTITLTPTTASGHTDPSTPIAAVQTANGGNDGDQPTMSDGGSLPKHGIFGTGVSFDAWNLGDFTLTDSPLGDWIGDFPTVLDKTGQINAYTVVVTGYTAVHFDAFNHIEAAMGAGMNDSIFAPFSHDGESAENGGFIPAPGAVVLAAMGIGLVGLVRRRLA
jgi:hypothetical protein